MKLNQLVTPRSRRLELEPRINSPKQLPFSTAEVIRQTARNLGNKQTADARNVKPQHADENPSPSYFTCLGGLKFVLIGTNSIVSSRFGFLLLSPESDIADPQPLLRKNDSDTITAVLLSLSSNGLIA